MTITVCTGKLYRVRVTRAHMNYEGSIIIDRDLMEAAGILPFQLLHINNVSNAVHWETYAIPGERGLGEIGLNGPPARLFQPGDLVVVLALEQMTREEAGNMEQKVIHVDEHNKIKEIVTKKSAEVIYKDRRSIIS